LLRLGLQELSVSPSSIPHLKSLIRQLDLSQIISQLRHAQQSSSTAAAMRSFANAEWIHLNKIE